MAADQGTTAKYEKVSISIQHQYFDVISRDDSQYWLPNERARKSVEENWQGRRAGLWNDPIKNG